MKRYTLWQDDKSVKDADSVNDLLEYLHNNVSYSWDHAFKHEGWSIVDNKNEITVMGGVDELFQDISTKESISKENKILTESMSDFSITWREVEQGKNKSYGKFIKLIGLVTKKNAKSSRIYPRRQSFLYTYKNGMWKVADTSRGDGSLEYRKYCEYLENMLNLNENGIKIANETLKDMNIDKDIRDMESEREDYGNPIANKWMKLDPFMNKEYKKLTHTGSGEMLNPLTREDIYKYGTKEEIEFLLEAIIMPASFIKSIMNFKIYLESPQGKDAKILYQNLLNQVIKIQQMGSMGIVQFLRDKQKQKPAGDFINFVDLLMKGKRPPPENVPVLINLP
jgi:hypothetical protein